MWLMITQCVWRDDDDDDDDDDEGERCMREEEVLAGHCVARAIALLERR
jgi:hypothetical protein